LRVFRPERTSDEWYEEIGDSYVFEHDLWAAPVQVPLARAKDDAGVSLQVWLADPGPARTAPAHEWDFLGSFLYLVEDVEHLKLPPFVISGVSALRALVDLVAGHRPSALRNRPLALDDLMVLAAHGRERYGEPNSAHPIEKLQSIGSVVGTPRMIETVYKVAYMTNEQAYSVGGRTTRVNDILAYPLYIAVL